MIGFCPDRSLIIPAHGKFDVTTTHGNRIDRIQTDWFLVCSGENNPFLCVWVVSLAD
jgi:hypothetical protein